MIELTLEIIGMVTVTILGTKVAMLGLKDYSEEN